ncbi:MAG TPA: DUF4097 family beta strand repeat-containing protein [Pyrinomonadaceae bacterium]|nr:DUF4097 family beta strand repeat-containing protein [Pyrinomonadaceae bacterium]
MLVKSLISLFVLGVALTNASSGHASRMQVGADQTGIQRATELETSSAGDPQELREEFHQTHPLSANGRVSLENLNGNVRIAVWDRNEVQVDAIKRAYRRERLNEARIEVIPSADAIRIKTVYPEMEQSFHMDAKGRYNNPAIVDYTVTVPRGARLESIDLINGSLDVDGVEGDVNASSINGKVIVRGLVGITKLSTVNGALEAVFARLDETKPITLGSVNGNLALVVPSDANAVVKASTVHGNISNDFGLEVQHGEYVGHELYGQLGSGGPRIKLDNVNGRIMIKHAQDGRQLSPATCLLPERKNKAHEEREEERERQREQRQEELEAMREQRELQAEVQREVERSMRQAQRELEQSQREIQREVEKEIREEMRAERGEGRGEGRGTGRGYKLVTQQESKTFTVPGPPRVNVVTFDGTVTVRGWDKSEVSYKATKKGRDGEDLKHIDIQTQQQGSSISIVAKSLHDYNSGTASLEVYVPRKSSLHVSSGDGELDAEGVSGDLTLRTGDGAIKVSNGKGQLLVNTGDGEIRVINFEGQVDARTGDGPISLEGSFVGLAARTGDGPISLTIPSGANFTIETNAEGIDAPGMTVSEDLAPSPRKKRWKVGRGGNVFVLNTGDGRITLHPR